MSSTQPATRRAPNSGPPSVAAGLRSLRVAKGLSLKDVAQATDISTSFLSLVENGKSDITIGRLVRLVNFYGVPLTDLVPATPHDSEPEITRVAERTLISHSSPAEGIDVYLLTPDTDRTMMPMELEFDPGAELAEFGRHQGEEWVYVMEGRLRLLLDGAEPRCLEKGDSAYYPADRPHLFTNDDPKKPLRLICVNSPPNL